MSSNTNSDLDRVSKVLSDLQSQIGDLQGRCSKINSEIDELSKKLKKKRDDISQLQEKLTHQEKHMEDQIKSLALPLIIQAILFNTS